MKRARHTHPMDELALSKVYHLIEPGPVVMVTTAANKRANVMTVSSLMTMDETRPMIGCMLGPWNYSFAALRDTRECVIAIPTIDIAGKVVDIGNCSGQDVDKFKEFDLTTAPASKVEAPLITDCLANLECRSIDDEMVEKYNFFVLEVVQAWIDRDRNERRLFHHNGDGTFFPDGDVFDLRKKMVKWPEHTANRLYA